MCLRNSVYVLQILAHEHTSKTVFDLMSRRWCTEEGKIWCVEVIRNGTANLQTLARTKIARVSMQTLLNHGTV